MTVKPKKNSLIDVEHALATGELTGGEFDPAVKWSFYNVLHPAALNALPKVDLRLFGMDEDELELMISPSPSLNRIRHVFWRMFHQAKEMRHPEIDWYQLSRESGVSQSAMVKYLSDPQTLAWILCPIVTHHEQMMEVYQKAVRKMREALNARVVTPDGYVDAKGLKEVVRIYELLDKRQHGEFVQSLQIKSDNRTITTTVESNGTVPEGLSIDAELEALEHKLKNVGALPNPDEKKPRIEDLDEYEQIKVAARERGIKVKVKET